MALYDIVRCSMRMPAEVAGVIEWRSRSFGLGVQTLEIDAEGAVCLFRMERRPVSGHPPRPALYDPGHEDWVRDWTRLMPCRSRLTGFSGSVTLEGRDDAGLEWTVEAEVLAGHARAFRLGGMHLQPVTRAA